MTFPYSRSGHRGSEFNEHSREQDGEKSTHGGPYPYLVCIWYWWWSSKWRRRGGRTNEKKSNNKTCMQSFQSVTATIYLFVEAGRNPTTYNGPVMEINIYFIPIIMAPSNTVTDWVCVCVHCVDLFRGRHQKGAGKRFGHFGESLRCSQAVHVESFIACFFFFGPFTPSDLVPAFRENPARRLSNRLSVVKVEFCTKIVTLNLVPSFLFALTLSFSSGLHSYLIGKGG